MPSKWTNGGLRRVLDGTFNLTSGVVKVMLLNTAYVPDPDHEFVSSLSAFEMSGTGYVGGFGGSGRKTLAGKAFAKDDTLNCATMDATDPTWAGADFGTAGFMAIVQEVTNNGDSPVLAILDLGTGGVLTMGGTFTVQLGSFALKLSA